MKKKIQTTGLLLILAMQIIFSTFLPIHAFAQTISDVRIDETWGQAVTINGNGQTRNMILAPIYADNDLVFCLDPWTAVQQGGGYVGNPDSSVTPRIQLISVLWKRVGTDIPTYLVAQEMIWNELGVTLGEWTTENPTNVISQSQRNSIKNMINEVIERYRKLPSFHGQSVTVTLGQSVNLIDSNSVGLSAFDRELRNSANVNYSFSGNTMIISGTSNSNASGELRLFKGFEEGTPIVFTKDGSQTLLKGKISDPAGFRLSVNIIKNGTLQILKTDKQSGAVVPNTEFRVAFSDNTPTKTVKTGANGIAELKDVAIDGTEVTVTEINVPAPYVLDPTPMKTKIIAGETVKVTQNNMRQKGQVKIVKTGEYSGSSMWSESYSLAGNVFDIRENSATGAIVVGELTTNEKGEATTTNDPHLSKLEVGKKYVLTERAASNGFVNTFKPVEFTIAYAGQTVEIVLKELTGSNREITGEILLAKQDKETESDETQGNAIMHGAQYGILYNADVKNAQGEILHKKGEFVRYGDGFAKLPIAITHGEKANDGKSDEPIRMVVDENLQVGLKHLPIGQYAMKEVQAPVGYTMDETLYPFEIAKQDDKVAVLTKEVTAQEQVIKTNLNFFKYVNSNNGSASSGANGLKFKLTPLDDTKQLPDGADVVTTANHPVLNFDGYGEFNGIPIGNYRFEEIEAPKGFQVIKPLTIRTAFNVNEEEYAQSTYTFTITEDGQDQPIKRWLCLTRN